MDTWWGYWICEACAEEDIGCRKPYQYQGNNVICGDECNLGILDNSPMSNLIQFRTNGRCTEWETTLVDMDDK